MSAVVWISGDVPGKANVNIYAFSQPGASNLAVGIAQPLPSHTTILAGRGVNPSVLVQGNNYTIQGVVTPYVAPGQPVVPVPVLITVDPVNVSIKMFTVPDVAELTVETDTDQPATFTEITFPRSAVLAFGTNF